MITFAQEWKHREYKKAGKSFESQQRHTVDMSSILLKNGTVLIHDDHEHVRPTNTDILIRGNTIIRIGKDLIVDDDDEGIEIIDCTDKIISPGIVDTHHHMWQTQLKGRHANHLLLQYMPTGNWQASNFTDSDIYWGQLGGCLEATWAGTTTVVDHAHMNYTPNSCKPLDSENDNILTWT